MRSVIGLAVAALVAAAAARIVGAAGALEGRAADAETAYLTLRYGALEPELEALDAAATALTVPGLGRSLHDAVRVGQGETRYWLGQYGRLGAERDAAGVLVESDPEMLRLAAHAMYRAAQASPDPQAGLRRLDDVAKAYADVLRAAPGDENAAWNYEFVVRLRSMLSQAKAPLPPAASRVLAGDLPTGATLHGQPGAPPAGTDMQKFKMVIPLRSDERNQLPQSAGQSEPPKRRG